MDVLLGMQRCVRELLVARGVESAVATVAGERVHHYRLRGQGRGPPVVLVHGLGGTANGFSRVLFGLARRFGDVWAPDLPGHGFSPASCGGPVCVRGQYEVLRGFVQGVVGAPALVVGNSLGGALAITLAAEVPQAVRALALVAPAGALLAPERLQTLLASFEVRNAAEARSLTRRLFHRVPLPVRLLGAELRRFYDTPTVRALVADAALTPAALSPEVLARLGMPTLLLWGASERLLPAESVDYFRAHLPPHARVEVVPRFGHIPQVERPRELVARLVRFADEARL